MSLTFKEFDSVNATRCKRWHPIKAWSLSDWMTALTGEIGEAANIIKKLNRHRDGVVGNKIEDTEPVLKDKLGKELADAVHYLFLTAKAADIDLEAYTIAKFNEVSEKQNFPERISAEGKAYADCTRVE